MVTYCGAATESAASKRVFKIHMAWKKKSCPVVKKHTSLSFGYSPTDKDFITAVWVLASQNLSGW